MCGTASKGSDGEGRHPREKMKLFNEIEKSAWLVQGLLTIALRNPLGGPKKDGEKSRLDTKKLKQRWCPSRPDFTDWKEKVSFAQPDYDWT